MGEKIILPQSKKYFAQKFALWVALCAIFMAFAGLTSALIVRRSASDWLQFNIPSMFYVSTVVIILSSVSLFIAHHHYRKDNFRKFRIYLISTFLLGLAFTILQLKGWKQIGEMGVKMFGDGAIVSGSFIGVISGWHLLHLFGGLFFLLIAIIRSFFIFKNPSRVLMKEIQPGKGIRMDLLGTYWHFVDVLWVYLFIFFIVNN